MCFQELGMFLSSAFLSETKDKHAAKLGRSTVNSETGTNGVSAMLLVAEVSRSVHDRSLLHLCRGILVNRNYDINMGNRGFAVRHPHFSKFIFADSIQT